MNDLKEVTAYRTSDGCVFEDITDAHTHQCELDFDGWYCDNYPLGNFAGSRVELNEMKDWLRSNKKLIVNFLGGTYE